MSNMTMTTDGGATSNRLSTINAVKDKSGSEGNGQEKAPDKEFFAAMQEAAGDDLSRRGNAVMPIKQQLKDQNKAEGALNVEKIKEALSSQTGKTDTTDTTDTTDATDGADGADGSELVQAENNAHDKRGGLPDLNNLQVRDIHAVAANESHDTGFMESESMMDERYDGHNPKASNSAQKQDLLLDLNVPEGTKVANTLMKDLRISDDEANITQDVQPDDDSGDDQEGVSEKITGSDGNLENEVLLNATGEGGARADSAVDENADAENVAAAVAGNLAQATNIASTVNEVARGATVGKNAVLQDNGGGLGIPLQRQGNNAPKQFTAGPGKSVGAIQAAMNVAANGEQLHNVQNNNLIHQNATDVRNEAVLSRALDTNGREHSALPAGQVKVMKSETFISPAMGNVSGSAQAVISQISNSISGSVERTGDKVFATIQSLQNSPNAVRTLELQLRPAELGSVTIKMRLSGDNLLIKIQADNVETGRAIEHNGHMLKDLLRQAGYRGDGMIVQFADHGNQQSASLTNQQMNQNPNQSQANMANGGAANNNAGRDGQARNQNNAADIRDQLLGGNDDKANAVRDGRDGLYL